MKKKRTSRYVRRRSTLGPGRGYRAGYSRFGRIAQPELKAKVTQGRNTVAANAIEDVIIFPTISQGTDDTQRIGNRIAGKFLNVKMLISSRRQPDASLPQAPPLIRYVIWRNKDPLSNANATIPTLTITSFLNTKEISIVKHGYCTLSAAGTAKVLSINLNMRNQVFDFKEQSDTSAATTQRYYLTMFTTQLIDYQYQSKFYFSDP